jgi:hypothetical protein
MATHTLPTARATTGDPTVHNSLAVRGGAPYGRGHAGPMDGPGREEARPQSCSPASECHENGRGERSQASGTDLFVPAVWPLEIALTGAERWTDGVIA